MRGSPTVSLRDWFFCATGPRSGAAADVGWRVGDERAEVLGASPHMLPFSARVSLITGRLDERMSGVTSVE